MAAPKSLNVQAAQAAEQIFVWQVAAQIVGALMTPLVNELTRGVNAISQTTPLTPNELADMVNRAIISASDAIAYAKQSGISPGDFQRLVAAAGDAISPQEAVLAFRRGIIPREGRGPDAISLEQAIAESRIRDKWVPTVEALGSVPVPPSDAVDAVVKGQINLDQGREWARQSGVDELAFEVLLNARGNPPAPSELAVLLKRKLIPLEGVGPDELSFQQGIYEGASKTKWWQLFAKLADYVTPPRTVTAMVREGSYTDQEAMVKYQESGLSETDAAAYLHSAHHQKTAAARELARTDLETLYQQGVLGRADASTALTALGYSSQDVDLLLTLVDIRREVAAVNAAISRVHGYYVARRIEADQASRDLDALRVPAAQRDQLLATWEIERASNLKTLTAAEVTSAYFYGLIDQDTATQLLVADGYDATAAWILLSVRKHNPQPNPPPSVKVPSRG